MSDERSPSWGQLVVGPPGAGKTTYCHAVQQFLRAVKRPIAVVNLDPANDEISVPYDADVDISELIRLEDVMDTLKLGPNGALVYCMEFLESNFSWLRDRIDELDGRYLVFDLPGQVELYTHHNALHNLLVRLQRELDVRLCSVHLVDAFHSTDPGNFLSAVMVSLSCMLRLELPHVNVLSKVDLIERFGKLSFGLDYYTDASDLRRLLGAAGGYASDSEGEEGEGAPPDSREGEGDGAPHLREGDAGEAPHGAAGGAGAETRDEDARGRLGAAAIANRHRAFFARRRRLQEQLCDVAEDFNLVGFVPLDIQNTESVSHLIHKIDKTNGYVAGVLGEPTEWAEAAANVDEDDFRISMAEKYTSLGGDDSR